MGLTAPLEAPGRFPQRRLAQASDPRRNPANLETALLSLLVFVLLAVLLFFSTWEAPFDRMIGIGGDGVLFTWYLRWPAFALSHGLNPLISNYVDYPGGINLMWNVSMPLISLIMTPATLTLGLVFAYNLSLTLGVALAGWTAFLVIRRWVPSTIAAGAGALLYAVSPYFLSQALGHLHVSLIMLPPLILLVLDEVLVRQRRCPLLSGAALGALGVAQLLISEEVLASCVLAGAIGVSLLVAMDPERARRHARHAIHALLYATATFLLLAGWPLAIQFFGPQRMGGGLQPTLIYSNDLLGFVVPSGVQLLAPAWAQEISRHFTGNLSEWSGYLGIPLLVVCGLVAARFWHRPVVRVAVGLGTMLALLSLGGVIHLMGWVTRIPVAVLAFGFVPFRRALPGRTIAVGFLLAWLALAVAPLFHNLLPGRLMLPVFLMAGIMMAVFVQWAMALRGRGRALAVVALLAVAASLFPRLPYWSAPLAAPAFFRPGGSVMKIPAGSVVLLLPFSRGDEPTAMYWQAESGMRFRMPEGYAYVPAPVPAEISPAPSATQDLLFAVVKGRHPSLSQDLREQVLVDLRAWNVRTVIVGPMHNEDEAVALMTAVLGRTPVHTQGVYLWSDVNAAD